MEKVNSYSDSSSSDSSSGSSRSSRSSDDSDEDSEDDRRFDYYPTGLVTTVVDTIEDMPNQIKDTLDEDSSKGEIMYQIVGYLNHYGKTKDKKDNLQEELKAICDKYSEGRLKTGGKKSKGIKKMRRKKKKKN